MLVAGATWVSSCLLMVSPAPQLQGSSSASMAAQGSKVHVPRTESDGNAVISWALSSELP